MKEMVQAIIDEDVYYPIELNLDRQFLTMEEAKELSKQLTAQIEIAECNQ